MHFYFCEPLLYVINHFVKNVDCLGTKFFALQAIWKKEYNKCSLSQLGWGHLSRPLNYAEAPEPCRLWKKEGKLHTQKLALDVRARQSIEVTQTQQHFHI